MIVLETTAPEWEGTYRVTLRALLVDVLADGPGARIRVTTFTAEGSDTVEGELKSFEEDMLDIRRDNEHDILERIDDIVRCEIL